MRRIFVVVLLLVCCVFFMNLFGQDATYVGSGKCKMCHRSEKQGQQYPLWEARKHSKSIAALTSEKALKTAQEKGMETKPIDNPACLKCHSPLYEKASDLKSEGVTCEVCHGPGSAYKKMSVMKDHAKAVAAGLQDYKSPDDIKKQCLPCHENAHDKSFNFAAAWEKVKHPRPEK